MVRLLASNVDSFTMAEIIVLGFPDNSKSEFECMTKFGPEAIRNAFNNTNYFEANGKKIPIMPMSGNMDKAILDIGDVRRKELYSTVFDISSSNKIPIILGGDHSLTTISIRAISKSTGKKLSLIYFDAHPDFVSSVTDFHGSVLTDSADYIDFGSSILIGIRAAEMEEFESIKKVNLEILSPLEIINLGLGSVTKRMISKCQANSCVYISIDLDCLDPGFAPGVSVPTPAGLMPMELLSLVKSACCKLPVVGLDIVELCPDRDLNHTTVNICGRLLLESMSSIRHSKKLGSVRKNKTNQKIPTTNRSQQII